MKTSRSAKLDAKNGAFCAALRVSSMHKTAGDITVRVMFLLAGVPFIVLGCARRQPSEPESRGEAVQPAPAENTGNEVAIVSPVIGRWQSFKIDGEDIGNFISEIRYTFTADGGFVAEATMADGSVDKKHGTFRIEGEYIYQFIEGATHKCRFRLDDGKLIVHDPFIDCSVSFEPRE
jgi:hypothetical protein